MSTHLLLLLALTLAVALPAYSFWHLFHSGRTPKGLYWAPSGENGLFAALDSSVKTVMDIRKMLKHGEKISSASSHGFKFSTLMDGAIVALPTRNFKWLANLPETTASFYKAFEERLMISYTNPAATITDRELSKMMVKVLTRRSKGTVADLQDEVQWACQEVTYGGPEWQTLCLYPEVLRILGPTSNRMLLGLPLCRDSDLLSQLKNYAETALPSALLIHLFPPVFHAKIGSLVRAWRIRRYHRRIFKILLPSLTKLLHETQQLDKTYTEGQGSFASWWFHEAIGSQNSKAMDPAILAAAVMQLNFAGLHSTSLATTTLLYYILSYENSAALVEDLRREFSQSSIDAGTSPRTWASLESMMLLDSVVRESLRCAPIEAVTINRSIVKAVTTPDGLHLSPGTRVCIPGFLANVDERHYANASTFDPYRFVKSNSGTGREKAWTVTDNFTTFGNGLHACPGRWFGISEMKLIVIHFLTHYEFEKMPSMPEMSSLATLLIPSLSHEIRIRGRRHHAQEK